MLFFPGHVHHVHHTSFQAIKTKREEKAKRKAENELKSASYQVLANPEKLKQMSKKQLRQIKRTRVNKDGVVELVGAYEK